MESVLISVLLACVILAIVFGVVWAILSYFVLPRMPAPFGQIISLIFWGIVAVVVILKVLVPLLSLV